MTRLFSAIFVVYIALISLQPCDEMFLRAGGIETQTAAVIASESSESGDPECRECSPFCFCSCCHLTAAFSYSINTFESKTSEFAASQLIPEYENANVLGYSNSIWQPPKA